MKSKLSELVLDAHTREDFNAGGLVFISKNGTWYVILIVYVKISDKHKLIGWVTNVIVVSPVYPSENYKISKG